MATIYSLKPSISQLSQEEVYSLIHFIRESRRRRREDTPKPKITRTFKAPSKAKILSQESLASMSKTLTKEQKASLLLSLLNL